MIRWFIVRLNQFLELYKREGLLFAIKFSIYANDEAVPVEKDLSELKPVKKTLENAHIRLIEMTENDLKKKEFEYPLKSRYEKAVRNIKKGFKTFAIVKNNHIMGDIWYVTKSSSKLKIVHPDLKLLGITLGSDEVYLFDMYVTPDERGKAIATSFMGSVLHTLKNRGFNKAYGFFVANNIPALWVHRLLGYKELQRISVKRYLFIQTSKPII